MSFMIMKKHKGFFYYIGNIFILLSLVGFGYILYPIFGAYFLPPQIVATDNKTGTFLTIPKISAQAPVILQVDPWNEAGYKEALKKGVAHASGTSLPGENGMVFLFAHSSAMPWELTRYNTIFLRLGELARGDRIQIQKDGEVFAYIVREKKEVFPHEVDYLLDTAKNELILQTCTPIGTSFKRLLVFADPEK